MSPDPNNSVRMEPPSFFPSYCPNSSTPFSVDRKDLDVRRRYRFTYIYENAFFPVRPPGEEGEEPRGEAASPHAQTHAAEVHFDALDPRRRQQPAGAEASAQVSGWVVPPVRIERSVRICGCGRLGLCALHGRRLRGSTTRPHSWYSSLRGS